MTTPARVEAMIAGVSAVIVLLLVPAVRWACNRLQFHDAPGPLKIHARPVPRLGGIAVAIAVAVPLLVWRPGAAAPHWQFCVALAIIWAAALADDLRQLPIPFRLAAQACAGFMLWLGGYRLPLVPNAAANSVATCIFVIAFVNAFNFLDGADGIAAGSAALAALAYVVVPGAAPGALSAAVACAALGACAGFLVFNFPPASIFLGDSGSNLLGFVLAFLALYLYRVRGGAVSSVLFSLMVVAFPLLDALLAIVRRALRRQSPFLGDRRHFYDLLLARGWPARAMALVCYLLTVIFTLAGSLSMRGSFPVALAVSLLVCAAYVVLAARLGSLRSSI